MTRSETRFGLVQKDQWSYPDWISEKKAEETRQSMKDRVPYGDSESYRHMCRYQSGFFFRHPLTLDLDYYWRVEPGIELHCDIDYDPFVFMAMNNKSYGFTLALHEFVDTVATLYDTTRDFVRQHPSYVKKDAAMHFLTDDPELSIASAWNLCHFWSNFEIGDLRFWRSKEYLDYFDHLDRSGGFFYERWGDAPVHSIAAALFLDKSRIHHFDDIGYFHHPWLHCPSDPAYHVQGKCSCDPSQVSRSFASQLLRACHADSAPLSRVHLCTTSPLTATRAHASSNGGQTWASPSLLLSLHDRSHKAAPLWSVCHKALKLCTASCVSFLSALQQFSLGSLFSRCRPDRCKCNFIFSFSSPRSLLFLVWLLDMSIREQQALGNEIRSRRMPPNPSIVFNTSKYCIEITFRIENDRYGRPRTGDAT
jgi:hypothetical protein